MAGLAPHVSALPFIAMMSESHRLTGLGPFEVLPRGPAATLGDRVRAFFRTQSTMAVLAGCLPFDRAAADYLLAASRVGTSLPRQALATKPRWSIAEEPGADAYAAAVTQALGLMADGQGDPLRKVVLARTLVATAEQPIDLAGLVQRLHAADPTVNTFLLPLPPQHDAVARHLVGATPELLISRKGRAVLSHPLAGSARRAADPAADAAARDSLTASAKDQREHAFVAEHILDILTPLCRTLAARGTAITSTNSMWHLGTRIEGELRDPDLSAADLAALLHPTPAVCGVPRDRAAALIPQLEGFDRDFYAGAVGWCDRAGDGVWHVAIRCAEIAGSRARLYAGAGIVPGSDPAAEVDETAAKFRAMLTALGIDEPARAPQ